MKHLKQDGFIGKNKEDILLWIQDEKIVINHQWLPESLQEKYLEEFRKYGLKTSYEGFIGVGEEYIIVKKGDEFSGNFDNNGNEIVDSFDYHFKPKRI